MGIHGNSWESSLNMEILGFFQWILMELGLEELAENRKSLEQAATASETEEQERLELAEQHEALLLRLKELEEELERLAAEQEGLSHMHHLMYGIDIWLVI